MKLTDLNNGLSDIADKYSIKKTDLNKEIATDNQNKHDMPERSGNQDTPVDKEKEKLLGTNPSGLRDKAMPTNLSV